MPRVKEKDYFDLGREPDLLVLKALIELIDGYRVNYFGDPRPFSERIRDNALGREVKSEWKTIYRALMKIATTVERIPEVRSYISLQSALRFLSIMLTLIGLSIPLINMVRGVPTSIWIPFSLATCGACMLVASWAVGRNMALAIEDYFREHKEKYKFVRAYLARVNQKLINSLRRQLEATGEDPDRYRLKLFNTDYKGIKVVKKPSLFRKRYIVSVEVG
ncbi:hypothetical protein DRO33_03385 [Candidatus Bathyarchaeota archaeon]|nr:MAG: hypothetical protein DRO33_03385 [Candidatus Bathyarchaeota archaeon]